MDERDRVEGTHHNGLARPRGPALRELVNVLQSSECPCRVLRHVSTTLDTVRMMSEPREALGVALALARQVDVVATTEASLAVCGDCARMAAELARLIVAPADPRLTIAAAARAAGLSKWHFSRRVARHTGNGFQAHLHRLRVLRALLVLQDSRLSVKETAARVGYRTAAELHRHMTKHLKLAPSRVRRNLACHGDPMRE